MKKKYSHLLLLLCLLVAISGCGGGGDDYDDDYYDDEDYVDVTGVWRGSVTLASDGCALNPSPVSFEFMHGVFQDLSSVYFTDEEGVHYDGEFVGDNGFSVDSGGWIDGSCSYFQRYRYESINHDDDRTADVRFMIIGECAGGYTCETSYSGSAMRP